MVRAVPLVLLALLVPHDVAEGVAAVGGAENGAAEVSDPADFRGTERDDAVEGKQAFVAALNPVRLPSPTVRRQYHGADDSVQAGGISAAGRDGDAHVSSRA